MRVMRSRVPKWWVALNPSWAGTHTGPFLELMSDFFEIDPISGIRTDFKWHESDQSYQMIRTADVEPALEAEKVSRNESGLGREDIKRNWWHYCTIPAIVQLQLRAKGINIHDKDHQDRMIAEINTNYPHLKLTTGKMGGKAKLFG